MSYGFLAFYGSLRVLGLTLFYWLAPCQWISLSPRLALRSNGFLITIGSRGFFGFHDGYWLAQEHGWPIL